MQEDSNRTEGEATQIHSLPIQRLCFGYLEAPKGKSYSVTWTEEHLIIQEEPEEGGRKSIAKAKETKDPKESDPTSGERLQFEWTKITAIELRHSLGRPSKLVIEPFHAYRRPLQTGITAASHSPSLGRRPLSYTFA